MKTLTVILYALYNLVIIVLFVDSTLYFSVMVFRFRMGWKHTFEELLLFGTNKTTSTESKHCSMQEVKGGFGEPKR